MLASTHSMRELQPSYTFQGHHTLSDGQTLVLMYDGINALHTFHSVCRLLWFQLIKRSTKIFIFKLVILSTVLYGLESAVLLE